MKYKKLYKNLHLLETQILIRNENKQRSGIYMIENQINQKKYIGSAVSNKINMRFRNHLIHKTGSKRIALAVQKYGLENFNFYILEYFAGFVKKENLNSDHLALLELETNYIQQIKPEYNILQQDYNSAGYKHTEDMIINLNLGVTFFTEKKQLFSKIAALRNTNKNLKELLRKKASKSVILYKINGEIDSKFPSIREMAKSFNCCNKTINKAIKSQSIFKGIGIIKYDESEN